MLKVHKADTYLNVEDTSSHTYIVNFSKIFEINIQFPLLKDLYGYNLTNKFDKTAKSLFYHHIIYGLTEYILAQSNQYGKVVIYNYINDLNKNELFSIYQESDIKEVISEVLTSCKKHLPLRIFEAPKSFYYFLSSSSGQREEMLVRIRGAGSEGFEKYTFDKAIKFANKHNLTFLSKQYFNELKTKQLLFC